MSRRSSYGVVFALVGTAGVMAATIAYAGLVMLAVAKRADAQLAHLEDWMPEAWREAA